jgi:acyl carrier protein
MDCTPPYTDIHIPISRAILKFTPPRDSGLQVILTNAIHDGSFRIEKFTSGSYFVEVFDGATEVYSRVMELKDGMFLPIALKAQATVNEAAFCQPSEIIKGIIVDLLGVDAGKVVPSASLVKDLGADRLDLIDITMDLEEAFQIQIGDKDAKKFRRVEDVTVYVEAQLKSRNRQNLSAR